MWNFNIFHITYDDAEYYKCDWNLGLQNNTNVILILTLEMFQKKKTDIVSLRMFKICLAICLYNVTNYTEILYLRWNYYI